MRQLAPRVVAALFLLAASGFAQNDPNRKDWIQLFNGRDLDGWVPKIAGYPLGENYVNTFRVENGLLRVSYDQYQEFGNRFGHLFYRKRKFSHYIVAAEYRFVGEQVKGGPDWAFRNNGIMFHCQAPETMGKDQDFPISIEGQLLGGNSDGKPRSTANMCSPGTEIIYQGKLYKDHCLNSSSPTFDGEQWVRAEFLVRGSGTITHFVNGQKVLEYEMPQYGGGNVDNYDATTKIDGKLIEGGYISLQSESHPIDFRKVELLNLAGCMDKAATNYKSYYIKPVPEDCKFSEGAKPAMRRPGDYPVSAEALPQGPGLSSVAARALPAA